MKKYIFLSMFLISVLLNSCSYPHYYYSTNIQNVPLFKENDLLYGYAAASIGEVNNCFEIQAGLPLSGHIALLANYMAGGKDNTNYSVADYSHIHYFEGSAGFYTSFKDIGVFELYGGYGKGSQQHAFAFREYDGWFSWTWVPDGTVDMTFSKIFIQPDIGVRLGWLGSAFSCRLSKLNFNEINVYNTVYRKDELDLLKRFSTPWIIEPALTFRAGTKSVKGQIQFIFATNLAHPDLAFEEFRINAGLHFILSKKQEEK